MSEAGDRGRGLLELDFGDLTALPGGISHTVHQVLGQQPQRDRLQRLGRRRDLGQHVDAVGVGLHHPLQTPYLALDPTQPGEQTVLAVDVTHHVGLLANPRPLYPWGVPM